jgi:hypothetical protein
MFEGFHGRSTHVCLEGRDRTSHGRVVVGQFATRRAPREVFVNVEQLARRHQATAILLQHGCREMV